MTALLDGICRGLASAGRRLLPSFCAVAASLLLQAVAAQAQGVIYSPGAVALPSTYVGASSSGTPIQFTVSGSQAAAVMSVDAKTDGLANLDFEVASENCSGTLSPPQNCIVTVLFHPVQPGDRHGAVTLYGANGNALVSVPIYGRGIASQLVVSPATGSVLANLTPLLPGGYATSAVVFDAAGNLYFNDSLNSRILERTAAGVLSVVASGVPTGAASGMVFTATGTLLVSSPVTGQVYAISGGQAEVLPYSGTAPVTPTGLTIDGNGYLYTADAGTGSIIRSSVGGGSAGRLKIIGLAPALAAPAGLVIGNDGALYALDSSNPRLVRIDLTTYAATQVPIHGMTLAQPYGLALDAGGQFYIADSGNGRIVTLTSSGSGVLSFAGAGPETPAGLAMDTGGNLAVADLAAGLIAGTRTTETVIFPTPTYITTFDAADGQLPVTFTNIGNADALVSAQASSATNPFTSATTFALGSGATCYVAASPGAPSGAVSQASVCSYQVGFTPADAGLNTAQLQLAYTTAGSPVSRPVNASVTLNGTGVMPPFSLSITASPSPVILGDSDALTVTVSGPLPSLYRGTIVFTSTDPKAAFLSGTSYTFTAADAGSHTFTVPAGVRFGQVGTFTVSITDGTLDATSNPVTVLNPTYSSALSLFVTPNPAQVSSPVSFSSTVTCTVPGAVPTGTTDFFANSKLLATVAVGGAGAAGFQSSFATAGAYAITAVYSGDANCKPATSPATGLVVLQQFPSATSLTVSPGAVLVGSAAQMAAAISCTAPGIQPGGTVSFLNAGTLVATANVVNGQAVTVYAPALGSHTLIASYSGDANCSASASGPVPLVVGDFALALTTAGTGSQTIFPGKTASYNLTLSAVGPSTLVSPVTLTVSGAPKGGVVTLSPSSFAMGTTGGAFTVSITPPLSATLDRQEPFAHKLREFGAPVVFALLLLPFLARRRRSLPALLLLLLIGAGTLGLTGCLSDQASGYFGVPPATSTVTVTATSGTLSRSVTVTLTVE